MRAHAPRSAALLGPPAADSAIDRVEAAVGSPLPADLRAWWRHSCGCEPSRSDQQVAYIPAFSNMVFGIDSVLDQRDLMLEIFQESAQYLDPDEPEPSVSEAGSASWIWLPEWVPIAQDGCGALLFLDLRPGPLHGCVLEWDKVEAATGDPEWPSVSAMLSDTADALEGRHPVDGWTPALNDGWFGWE